MQNKAGQGTGTPSTFIFDRAALNRAYRYCFSLTGDEDAAYDLLQDGLERYLRAPRTDIETPSAFLRGIIRNRFLDGLRDPGARLLGEVTDMDPDCLAIGFPSLENLVMAEQDLERVWALLDPFERELLHLWALEGFTAKEVASQLDLPLGTVLSRIHRLRRRLAPEDNGGADVFPARGGAVS